MAEVAKYSGTWMHGFQNQLTSTAKCGISAAAAANRLGIRRQDIAKLLRLGKLERIVQAGNNVMIRQDSFNEFRTELCRPGYMTMADAAKEGGISCREFSKRWTALIKPIDVSIGALVPRLDYRSLQTIARSCVDEKEAAAILAVHAHAVKGYIRRGVLTSIKLRAERSKKWLIREEVMALAEVNEFHKHAVRHMWRGIQAFRFESIEEEETQLL